VGRRLVRIDGRCGKLDLLARGRRERLGDQGAIVRVVIVAAVLLVGRATRDLGILALDLDDLDDDLKKVALAVRQLEEDVEAVREKVEREQDMGDHVACAQHSMIGCQS
jgi:outer membrane murein-binding lipoprotein Lpp